MLSEELKNAGYASIDALIAELTGTCDDFNDSGVDVMNLSDEEIKAIDDAIFNCAMCGWWYDITDRSSEIYDEMVCTNCEDSY